MSFRKIDKNQQQFFPYFLTISSITDDNPTDQSKVAPSSAAHGAQANEHCLAPTAARQFNPNPPYPPRGVSAQHGAPKLGRSSSFERNYVILIDDDEKDKESTTKELSEYRKNSVSTVKVYIKNSEFANAIFLKI